MNISRKKILGAVIIVLMTACIWKGAAFYGHWKAERSLERAREYLKEGRLNEAVINIQISIQKNAKNPAAWKLLAETFESTGSAEALQCRRKVVELLPDDPKAKIEFARCSLIFNQLAAARAMLAQITESGGNRPDFLEMQAMLSSASGDIAGAAELFGRLMREFPGTTFAKNAQLNLSKIWLLNGLSGAPEQAANSLEDLIDDPQYGGDALRLLIRRSLKTKDSAAAFHFSCLLTKSPNARMDDHLLMLDLMQYLKCPLYYAALDWMERSVEKSPASTANLAEWVMNRQGPQAAIDWLNHLPPAFLQAKPLPIVLADCYSRLKDWSAVQSLLSNQNWGPFNPQRNAFLSTAYRNVRQGDLAGAMWDTAVSSAQRHPGSLESLARLAFSENRPDDAVGALWKITTADPAYAKTQQQLFVYYRQRNDSANLLRLLKRTLEERPNDPSVKLSVATLLLVRNSQPDLAARLAKEVYQADPKPVRHAAVYAFSIYRENPSEKTATKAAAILDALSQQEKSSDDCLVYYGLILAGCNRFDEARDCFRKMNRNSLFPEMLQQVHEAEARMQ